MTYKNTILSLLLTLVVGLAVWVTLRTYRPLNVAMTTNTSLPDAFMEDVSAIIIDKEGKPKLKIVTPKMVHFTEMDITQLTHPHLTLYRRSTNPWLVTSKKAKARQGILQVDFFENVVIQHAADETNPATLIKTESLSVFPDSETAKTNDFITFIQPNVLIKAIGMNANLKTGEIKLLSQARGVYAPQH